MSIKYLLQIFGKINFTYIQNEIMKTIKVNKLCSPRDFKNKIINPYII